MKDVIRIDTAAVAVKKAAVYAYAAKLEEIVESMQKTTDSICKAWESDLTGKFKATMNPNIEVARKANEAMKEGLGKAIGQIQVGYETAEERNKKLAAMFK